MVGLQENTPGCEALADYVRQTVGIVDVPWLHSSATAHYLPVQVQTTLASVGQKAKSGKRKRTDIVDG